MVIVAIFVLLLVYVNAPELLLTGFVKLNDGSPYFFVEGTTKFVVHVGGVVICILHLPKRFYRFSFTVFGTFMGRTYRSTTIFSYGVVNGTDSSCNLTLSAVFVKPTKFSAKINIS